MKSKIKVLIVDDSATIRRLLTSIFEKEGNFEIRAVELPSQVEDAIRNFKPNVITLDIHMPEMNGVQLLKKISPKFGIPTVMITSVSSEDGTLVLDALEAGAIDYIQKPTMQDLRNAGPIICEKIKIAAQYRRKKAALQSQRVKLVYYDQECLIAIGSSTGGTEAVREILIRLPAEIPPIVVTQHIPEVFSLAWATRLNGLCPFEVKEAVDGDAITRGRVLIAPGGKQLRVEKARGGGYRAKVTDEGPINRHSPSVDVLFESVADVAGMHAIGLILTGMGADGAKGLLRMRSKGARTIAQDESTCVVFGMPKEAIKLGAAKEVVPLYDIPDTLAKWLKEGKAA